MDKQVRLSSNNIEIRKYTKEEYRAKNSFRRRKDWARRAISLLMIILSLAVSGVVDGLHGEIIQSIVLIELIAVVLIEIFSWYNNRQANGRYFYEILVEQRENSTGEEDTKSYSWPVIGVDTTTKQRGRFYLSKQQYDNAEYGSIFRVTLRKPEL